MIGNPPRLSLQPAKALRNKSRLADARLACDQHQLAFAFRRFRPALHEHADLMLAPDKRSEAPAVHGVEPAFRLPLAIHPPDADGLIESLQALLAEVGEGKVLANKPDSLSSDDDRIFPCGGLKPGGTVRRIANHRTLFVDTRADEIANHHLAGRNADARRERCPARRDESLNRGDCRHRRPYGPLGVVFMGLRPSEIDEQAIAERLRDIAAETDNFVADRLLVAGDDVLHVLRIEPRGELGRNRRDRRT